MDHDLVYVSRRLGDADPESERLIEHLRAYFTPDRLVMADPATGGRDPGARMESCAIVIAVIDLPWLRHLDWLKRGDDLVHAEIDWAIRHGRPVLPVIVGDVSLPEPEDVPLNLHPMFMHRRLHLDDTTEAEIQSRLLGPLEDLIASPEERARPSPRSCRRRSRAASSRASG